ncbi:uncharacterized protein LOC128989245 isoform X1 [Macrosteles quadrilineatus]|uniref:uncharacterized protein LOC128989245 isoform X1 n=1 Tax=Macrosteles quadrilineatus TaxID=74068 RepID=UPI0023E23950|nr:uncharacterized protein LOC128989245 isoform X1 [Macrosteles quadrilineatus]XP_054267102.1 uncharacterized protein LOC128989245 isoform X1 [Macrosteles quadrilineatus]XP_054267111.1 uncharacterized protein LOC128989245 isoform X1 [Macrosteles quadrilineatus]
MTAESLKRHHHHHHHHQHQHKKMVHLKSIERITNLPVFESAVAYYGNMKKSNPLIKWGMLPAETGMWLAVGTAMPVVAYFEKPVSAVDNIACKALDVIEANIPVVTYPPDLIYNISKDYVTNKVVTPMLKRADSVKQLSKHGASICGELAADRLNNAIDVADKYVDKYLPDITDGAETPSEDYGDKKGIKGKKICRPKNRLQVYSDIHGKQLTDKLKKFVSDDVEIFACVNPGASSSYIVKNAIKSIASLTKADSVVLITGLDDVALGRNVDLSYNEYMANINLFAVNTYYTNAFVCPIFPQYDLPLNGVINNSIVRINDQLDIKLSKIQHISLLNISDLERKHFSKNGLRLNGQGKHLLASIIATAATRVMGKFNENPAPLANSDSKTAATFQHVNQFSRKLQRRLTRRTIAEAKALKQQGADTIRCLVYLVDLLARDPKAFMEKGKAMWMELSKDEPENQVPPQNLEQLITLLTREIARRVVHLTNFTGAKVVLLSQYTVHVAHISALNAVWWADYFLKAMHLETAMEMTATQITRIHHFSVHLMERLVELIINLKKELKSNTPAQPVAAPAIKPIQSQPIPPVPEHLPASPSPQSSPSNVMSTPSLPATGGKHFNSHNGDTYTLYESNHESSVTS